MPQLPDYNVIIAGSRGFLDYILLSKLCFLLLSKVATTHIVRIFTGKAKKGADSLGEQWAHSEGFEIVPFPADWSLGRAAGLFRNEAMAKEGHCLIAFWDGQSKGTKHMIEMAKRYGLSYRIVLYKEGYILIGQAEMGEVKVPFHVFNG